MEKALDASSGATPARSIVEALADKFTNSSDRNGREVQWKQVCFLFTWSVVLLQLTSVLPSIIF